MDTALLAISWLALFSLGGLVAGVSHAESGKVQSEQCPSHASEAVQVSAVYPTADVLPENLLRFYIYFERPMRTENTLSYIYLTDEQGVKQEGVFLDNKFNLWSPDRRRLTLLFDPGRVKTGLVAHKTYGRALTTGEHYQLVIDAAGINGLGCSSYYAKRFLVEKADYNKPIIADWVMSQPKAATKEPLTVKFKAPIDHTSLAYRLRVKDSKNQYVAGAIDLGANEKQWIFIPNQDWQENEQYHLVVDPVLEDIAGNRISGLFDQPSLREESKVQNHLIFLPLILSQNDG